MSTCGLREPAFIRATGPCSALASGCMLCVTRSLDVGRYSIRTGPQFEDQQAPSEVPENADRVREAVAGAVAHEICLHGRRKSKLPGPAAGIKDDLLRI